MQIVADLQLHSKYSRAVSQRMDLYEIGRWSGKKGIQLVATGDWTHPVWFREIQTQLIEDAAGIYKLKKPETESKNVRYLLSTEINSIYSKAGSTRRVHNLLFSPSLEACEKFIKKLVSHGAKLMSDGRPIVGTPSETLLEWALEIDENFLFIPAHAWTPWYGMFGSQSGFDSLKEAFGPLEKYIYAIETGLSSDPLMNWGVEELNDRSILSFSDAHSGPKIGREATVFTSSTDSGLKSQSSRFTYKDISDAIKRNPDGNLKVGYTIEFFPEEGKYHWSGHRACGVRYSPAELKAQGPICPVCKKRVTIGVENRVIDLSKKIYQAQDLVFLKNKSGLTFVYDSEKKRTPFVSMIPLLEILLELNNHSLTKAQAAYESLIFSLGTEFDILLRKDFGEIERSGGEILARAIKIVRERKALVDPGFDGVFGKVNIFGKTDDEKTETEKPANQQTLF